MRKIFTMLIITLSAVIFAQDWFTKKELVTDLKTHIASKDTTWNTYVEGSSGYIWTPITRERATFYDVSDFGLSYPMNIHGVRVYVTATDIDSTFSFKIYDKDGTTELWHSDPIVSIAYDNEVYLDVPILIQDDFWVSVVPNVNGYPRVFSGLELGTDPSATHTFLKQIDGTWNSFTDGVDYYEMFAYVLLEPYSGTDILAPTIREISGTEVFMLRDMNITITVHEQNSVVSPMQAQYNVGTGWVDFELTQAKGAYTFTGIVPGQAGDTSGFVRFYLTDDQSNAEWSDEYPISWSRDLPIFSEGFEGDVFPPEGWTLNTTGAGFVRVDQFESYVPIYDGNYCASHLDDQGAQDDWLITPQIALPADNSCTFTFWQNAFFVEFLTYNEVCVSTDMVNWTTIYVPPFDPANWELTENIWQEGKFTLGNWAGQTIYIGFHYQGDYSNQWYIDDAKLFYDYQGPQIASISGNSALLPVIGAYLNNPMVLNLNITDFSGVKSVTGHYNIGGQTGDLNFTKNGSIVDEWTGTIPAQSAEASGTINFTLTDVGDLVTETSNFDIAFVGDTDVAVVKYLIGNEAFIGSPMNLELAFYEESAIDSCVGYYSKDNFASVYQFDLNPSKIHEYTYTGSIPAESEEVFLNGKVYFEVKDSSGNKLITDQYDAKWLDGAIEVQENFEGDLSNWTVNGYWGIEEEPSISGTHSLTESVNRTYGNNQNTYCKWAQNINWSSVQSASISFWVKYDIESGFDYMHFEVSRDGGLNWIRLKSWDGVGVSWNKVQLPMNAAAGSSQMTFRFNFQSDQGLEMNGMYIDDIELRSYNSDYSPPTIVHSGPQFYEGEYANFTKSVSVTDYSGVSEVRVYYTVDSIEGDSFVNAVNTSGSDYEFTIPAQEAGKTVIYRIWAKDASANLNSGFSEEYFEYIAGQHVIYDAGIVSYYTTTDTDDAKAVKITVPGKAQSKIAYALIRNYQDLSHLSGTMKFHIWADNGGVPGIDMIEPFDFESDCTPTNSYAMTRIDLRSYDLTLTGDFWIGFSAKNGIVYSTMESPGEEGTTPYNRSFDGAWNGSGWDWEIYAGANYHIRAILGDFTVVQLNELSLISPNGGEVLSQGSSYEITWADDFDENVKIELYKDSLFHSEIISSTESDSIYLWTVPNDISGTDYKIKITSVSDSLVCDMSDSTFTIMQGSIAITSPNGGEKYLQNSQMTISWLDNISENVKIELYKSGALHSVIKSSAPSSGTYLWSIPALLSGQDFKIKISSVDLPEVHSDMSDSTFILLSGKVAVLNPNGGEVLERCTQYEIKWLDILSENVKIELYQNDALHSTIVSSTPSDGSYLWDSSLSGNNFKIKISSVVLPTINNDLSDGNFAINAGFVSLSSPVAEAVLEMYETNAIEWTDNIPEDIVVSLYKDTMFVTSFNVPSTGTCNWHFYLDSLTSGNDYKIRLESSLYSEAFDESDYFTIKGTNNVEGSISGTWSESGSPYIITGNSYISQSDTLIINPKVKVRGAHGNDYLNVQGKLASNGAYNGQVMFLGIDLNFNNSASQDSSMIMYSSFGQNEEYYIFEYSENNIYSSNEAKGSKLKTKFKSGKKQDVEEITIGEDSKTVFKTQTIRINDNSKVIIQNCRIENISNYGVIVNNAAPAISNNLISGNHSGIKFVNSSSYYITNNTIADNDSIGLYFDGNYVGMFINNIVYGNGVKQVYLNNDNSDPDFFYNNIQNGQTGFGLNNGVTYTGIYESNINSDPFFEYGSFKIQDTSPCANSGYPDLAYDNLGYLFIPQRDLSGELRLNGIIDMGCYENWASIMTPESPTNVILSENAGTINISWDLIANAKSYYIYSSNNPYGAFDCVAIVATNSWSAPIGANTSKFYFVISSSETVGRSAADGRSILKKIKIRKVENILKGGN